ncbi:MAG: DUF3179 domain-containing protein [Candidatus Promineifilaceae bacterium]
MINKAWILILLFAFVVASCTASVEDSIAPEVVSEAEVVPTDELEPTNEPDPTKIPEPTATAEEAMVEAESAEAEPAVDPNDPFNVGDDRSNELASLTNSWNTDWTRRTISTADILSGGPPRDGIPSIDAPKFVDFSEADQWVVDVEPVIALEINGDARAYPIQVITWHEIVNDVVGDQAVVVTFCPLCNSAIVFDATLDGEPVEFGVSGLLRNSDLIMYDRRTETLWQQFTGEGLIGEKAGEQLPFLASSLISYANFKDAYPEGVVLSRDTGHNRQYGNNPYAGYDSQDDRPFLFSGEIDERLAPVDRVVTVRLDGEQIDIAYPVNVLAEIGVANDTQGSTNLAVFHLPGTTSGLGDRVIAEAEDVGATAVFSRDLNGQTLTFTREGDVFVDAETASQWNIAGRAIDGELAGQQLEPIVHADHFWFSWAAFRPDTIIYQAQ